MRQAGTGCPNCCPCCAPAGGGAIMPQERAGGAVARPDRPRASYHGGKGGNASLCLVSVTVRARRARASGDTNWAGHGGEGSLVNAYQKRFANVRIGSMKTGQINHE